MRPINCDIKFAETLKGGQKTVFIEKGEYYKHLEVLEVYLCDGGKKTFAGYIKICRIKLLKGKDFYDISLKDVARFRAWITFSNKYGLKTVQQLIEELESRFDIKSQNKFQLLEVYPLNKTPYTQESMNNEC